MPFAVNTQDTSTYRQYAEATQRLANVIKKAAELGRAEGQTAYVDLCEEVVSGLLGPSGTKLVQALAERARERMTLRHVFANEELDKKGE